MIDLKGIGSEGAIVNLLISAFIIYQVYIKPKMMRKEGKERRKSNPHPAPGNAEQCKEHLKGLTECETEIRNIKDNIKESDKKNREDHQEIFKKIDNLKNSR